jgi:hypothetical protein
MNVNFDEDLLLVLLMRGLPTPYEMFCSSVRHRESVPKLSQFFAMLINEEKLLARKQVNAHSAVVPSVSNRVRIQRLKCSVCKKNGHDERECRSMYPEKAPVCHGCNQRGHLEKYCRNKSDDVVNTSAELPPISP